MLRPSLVLHDCSSGEKVQAFIASWNKDLGVLAGTAGTKEGRARGGGKGYSYIAAVVVRPLTTRSLEDGNFSSPE